ncbi:hypothetical protein OHT20_27685 [Streptomyces caniferus]|nr:hypothetical protein [Streptomyces caniferus]
MLDAACAYAGRYDVILDGILGPWMLEPFRATCRQRGLGLSYVVLRPSLDVALARAARREGRHLKDIERLTGLYGAFEDLGALESHVVDSSAQSAAETAAEITAGLWAGRFATGAAPRPDSPAARADSAPPPSSPGPQNGPRGVS